jgi:hypothetical protein
MLIKLLNFLLLAGCESQGAELMGMKGKLLATLGRGAEATQVLLATPAITGANRALIQALIYKADNKLGNGKNSFSIRIFFYL